MKVMIDGVEYAPAEEKPDTVTIGDLEWSHTLLDGESVNYKAAEKAVSELGEALASFTRRGE